MGGNNDRSSTMQITYKNKRVVCNLDLNLRRFRSSTAMGKILKRYGRRYLKKNADDTPGSRTSRIMIHVSRFIYNEALTKIENKTMEITGKKLSEFGMTSPQRSEESVNDIARELDYNAAMLQQRVKDMVPK